MRLREGISAACARLNGISETTRLDAELLAAYALGVTREAMLLGGLDRDAPEALAGLIDRRAEHEPVAYITGHRAFWTIEVEVGPGVLIPRADSETLIEAAVDHFAGTPGPRSVLDLGTGSGALLLAVLDQWPDARGIGVDNSQDALDIARANVRRLGFDDRAALVRGGWIDGGGPHDLILCNPPYVADGDALPREVAGWEPAGALFSGVDGLDDYRRIAPALRGRLEPGGVACIEIGSEQARAAGAMFAAAGFDPSIRRDLAGRDRCLVLRAQPM